MLGDVTCHYPELAIAIPKILVSVSSPYRYTNTGVVIKPALGS